MRGCSVRLLTDVFIVSVSVMSNDLTVCVMLFGGRKQALEAACQGVAKTNEHRTPYSAASTPCGNAAGAASSSFSRRFRCLSDDSEGYSNHSEASRLIATALEELKKTKRELTAQMRFAALVVSSSRLPATPDVCLYVPGEAGNGGVLKGGEINEGELFISCHLLSVIPS